MALDQDSPGRHATSAQVTFCSHCIIREACFSLSVKMGPQDRNSSRPPARGQGRHHSGQSRRQEVREQHSPCAIPFSQMTLSGREVTADDPQ